MAELADTSTGCCAPQAQAECCGQDEKEGCCVPNAPSCGCDAGIAEPARRDAAEAGDRNVELVKG